MTRSIEITRVPAFVVLGVLALASNSPLLVAAMPTPEELQPVKLKIDAVVAAREAPSISVAAIRDGHIIWKYSSGWANMEERKSATPATVYRLGSVSKSITSTIAAIAASRGQIDLSRSVTSYLPALSQRSDQYFGGVTLADLLNMQAGLEQAVYYKGRDGDALKLNAAMLVADYAVRTTVDPGRYAYSNMGPALVSEAIAVNRGETFRRYARHAMFDPLGMTHTYLSVSDVQPGAQARSYRHDGKPFEREFDTYPAAGAGMLASLDDMATYAIFHLAASDNKTHGLLKADALSALHEPHTAGYYGNGWGVFIGGGYRALVSDGQVNGGQAMILLEPQRSLAVVVLCNVANDIVNELAIEAMDKMSPGFADAFRQSRELLGVAYEAKTKNFYPQDAELVVSGFMRVSTKNIPFHAQRILKDLEITIGDQVSVRATAEDPDAGYLRWKMPCPDQLPACGKEANPVARLYLTRSGGALSGYVQVESQIGAFPYALKIQPAARQ